MKLIGTGAEALIYKDKEIVIKDRIRKSYRHKDIDLQLRKFRTKREAKVLQKLKQINFPAPEIIETDDKKMKIKMDFIKGDKLRDILHKHPEKYSTEIGKNIATLHKNNIIHSDLTTSNMILNNKLYFIDFGLSLFSSKIEDKAVDLHLIERALESKHPLIYKKCFKAVIASYKKTYPKAQEVINRLNKVKLRGRNKGKFTYKHIA